MLDLEAPGQRLICQEYAIYFAYLLFSSPSCKVSIIFSKVSMAVNLIYKESFLWEMEWWRQACVFLLFPSKNDVYLGRPELIRVQHGDGRSVFLWHYNRGRKKAMQEWNLKQWYPKMPSRMRHTIAYLDIYKVPCTLSSSSDQCGAQRCVRSFSSDCECLCFFIPVPAVFGNFCVCKVCKQHLELFKLSLCLPKEQVKNYFGDGKSLKPAH